MGAGTFQASANITEGIFNKCRPEADFQINDSRKQSPAEAGFSNRLLDFQIDFVSFSLDFFLLHYPSRRHCISSHHGVMLSQIAITKAATGKREMRTTAEFIESEPMPTSASKRATSTQPKEQRILIILC
jgi:hypothetical protein